MPEFLIDVPAKDVNALPPCDERAVLLAAIWAENRAHTSFGWDNTAPMLFQFLGTTHTTGPEAEILPTPVLGNASMVDKLNGVSELLRARDNKAMRMVERGRRYLGTGLIHEAWLGLPESSAREEARLVVGNLVTGEPFYVKRIRDQEPTVSLAEIVTYGTAAGVAEALADLNEAFLSVYSDNT